MPHVVFAVPFAMDNTMRFVRKVAALPGVRLSVLSQDPPERFPADVRDVVDDFQQVPDALSTVAVVDGIRALAARAGGRVDRVFGILEQAQEAIAEAREALGIRGMAAASARNFRDKARMKEVLRAHDVPCARFGLARSAAEARGFAAQCPPPLVVKPPAGAGAKATFRVDRTADLDRYLEGSPPSVAAPLLLEEFIVGRELSFDSVTVAGQHVLHSVSSYQPTPLEVMREPWIQWAVLLPRDVSGPEFAAIHQAGPRALTALGMVEGISHMEWFRRPDGSIAVSEVAARPPGAQFMTLLSLAYDVDFYAAWAELMVFGRFQPVPRRAAAGAVYLRGQGQGRVRAVHGLDVARRELGGIVVDAHLPQAGQAPSGSYEGEGYVILRHPVTEVVEAGLQRLVSVLRVELG